MHDKILQRRAAVAAQRKQQEGAQRAQALVLEALDGVFDEIIGCEDEDVRAGMQEVVGRLAQAAVGEGLHLPGGGPILAREAERRGAVQAVLLTRGLLHRASERILELEGLLRAQEVKP